MTDNAGAIFESSIPGYPLIGRGKVRDIYSIDDEHLLIVTTDRLSAFDVVMPDPVPGKGEVLTQISLFWLGHSFLNVAVYASDARARQLPLLGGNRAGHDWHYMLGRLGILEYDHFVGWIFFALGVAVFLIMLVLPRYAMWSGSEES